MRIANTVNDSIVDGHGLRFTVFTQGCPHHCPGCHNPGTMTPPAAGRPPWRNWVEQMKRTPSSRASPSRGESPLPRRRACADLARAAHGLGLNVWTYSGYLFEHLRDAGDPAWTALLSETDVLVDGPFLQKEKSYELHFRGSRNQRPHRCARQPGPGQGGPVGGGGPAGQVHRPGVLKEEDHDHCRNERLFRPPGTGGSRGRWGEYAILVPLASGRGNSACSSRPGAETLVGHQPGEVCFPGGRREAGERPVDTALRETWEEIGIPAEDIDILAPWT